MNAQEAILKLKAMFVDIEAPVEEVKAEETPVVEETKVEMAEYSLMDGTKVEISALEIGGTVLLADGTPAPAGEHQLMDGTQIQLDENGIIVEISAKTEDATSEPDTEVEAKKEEDKKMQEMAEQFEAKFAELVEAKIAAEKRVEELESKIKQGFAQVADLIEALSNTPAVDPIQRPNSFESFTTTKDMKELRLEKYRNALLNN